MSVILITSVIPVYSSLAYFLQTLPLKDGSITLVLHIATRLEAIEPKV